MDLKELKELIRLVSEKGITEFEMEREGIRLRICRSAGPEPAAPAAPIILHSPLLAAPPPPPEFAAPGTAPLPMPVAASTPQPPPPDESLHILTSPIVGTFYRSPNPEAQPFTTVGARVERGAVLCIVEAMKLMNEITSEVTGVVEQIFVENGQPVEFGQPLFGIKI